MKWKWVFILLEIYYTPTSAIIADALAKTYEVVSLETARNIAKKFKASLKQKTDLYVIESILIDAGYKKSQWIYRKEWRFGRPQRILYSFGIMKLTTEK